MDSFNVECEDVHFDDWLPSLQRAALWYCWSEQDQLLQLAGHLRGRALQEWELLCEDNKKSLANAIKALRARLDPGSKMLAAQDFKYTKQREGETVDSFVRRLEKAYQRAYGHDGLLQETRDTLLYGQLHEGLR